MTVAALVLAVLAAVLAVVAIAGVGQMQQRVDSALDDALDIAEGDEENLRADIAAIRAQVLNELAAGADADRHLAEGLGKIAQASTLALEGLREELALLRAAVACPHGVLPPADCLECSRYALARNAGNN